MQTLSIIIPVYNERRTIREVLDRVEHSDIGEVKKEIIVVDDYSTDGTREILEALKSKEGYKILFHQENKGKGGALKTGLKEATGDFIVIQDADLEYEPMDYVELIQPLKEQKADSVFGSRILLSNNVPVNAIYFYGGLLSSKVFNVLFRTNFSDIHTCYKVFPRRFIPQLLELPSNDFVFDAVELTYTLMRGGSVLEVPIRYRARSSRDGKKLSWQAGFWCIVAMARIKFGLHTVKNKPGTHIL